MAFPAASPVRQEAKPTRIAPVPVQAGSLGLVPESGRCLLLFQTFGHSLVSPGSRRHPVHGAAGLPPHSLLQKWPKQSILSDPKGSVYRSHSLVVAIYWPTVYLHGRTLTYHVTAEVALQASPGLAFAGCLHRSPEPGQSSQQ